LQSQLSFTADSLRAAEDTISSLGDWKVGTVCDPIFWTQRKIGSQPTRVKLSPATALFRKGAGGAGTPGKGLFSPHPPSASCPLNAPQSQELLVLQSQLSSKNDSLKTAQDTLARLHEEKVRCSRSLMLIIPAEPVD
jgi:hypothetical protein